MESLEKFIFLSLVAGFSVTSVVVVYYCFFYRYITIPFREFTPVEARCSIQAVDTDGFTLCKGNVMALVVELQGKDYSGLDDAELDALFESRKRYFESLPKTVTAYMVSFRVRVQHRMDTDNYSAPMAKKVAKAWSGNFQRNFRTRHFMVLSSEADSELDQIILAARGLVSSSATYDDLREDLATAMKDAKRSLDGFRPIQLQGDRISEFWAWLLNGEPTTQKLPSDGVLDGILSSTGLTWPLGEKIQTYLGRTERYSAQIIIKAPATSSSAKMMDALMQAKVEIALFQTFYCMEKQAALDEVEKRLSNVASFTKRSNILEIELEALLENLTADEFSLLRNRWVVEVFGNTKKNLERNVEEIRGLVENQGYQTAREVVNMEANFWSRFPGMANFNPRVRSITSSNASHMSTFPSAGEGFSACSWGSPVTYFKTLLGTLYAFTFHKSPEKKVLGNTLVIGGSDSGKTVLVDFLLGSCLKYPNFRAILFDRLHGQKVFTEFFDGTYISLENISQLPMNPLHVDVSKADNRMFLVSWLSMLVNAQTQEEKNELTEAVNVICEVPKGDRNLWTVADALGTSREGSLRRNLDKWLPGQGGQGGIYAPVFNGKHDALNFDSGTPIIAFDLGSIIDNPDVLGPLSYYMIHKILESAKEDGGYAVFMDELAEYLINPHFVDKIAKFLQQIRKTDGIFVGAAQDAPTILDHELAPKFLANIATYLLFPAPGAKEEHYMKQLGLNENEFHWIKGDHPRQVMLKRQTGESVILDIDLAPLGDLLKIFDSSAEAVAKMNEIKRKHHDWKDVYLSS